MGSARRMHLAQLVLRHRVLPQDPLTLQDVEPAWLQGLLEADPAQDLGEVGAVNLF
jgi:hypothetical protein